jgi:hypothetical protein
MSTPALPIPTTAAQDNCAEPKLTRGPYDLDDEEKAAAAAEASAYVKTHNLLVRRAPGQGTYHQIRPGLGIKLYHVDCTTEPHRWTLHYTVTAWRTHGEKRFGEHRA